MFILNELIQLERLRVDLGDHHAIFQIVGAPFEIPVFPGQRFPSFCSNFTLCCQQADRIVALKRLNEAARTYMRENFHYDWDFSLTYNLTDPPLSCCQATRSESLGSQPRLHLSSNGARSEPDGRQPPQPGTLNPSTGPSRKGSIVPSKRKTVSREDWYIKENLLDVEEHERNPKAIRENFNSTFQKSLSTKAFLKRIRDCRNRIAKIPQGQLFPPDNSLEASMNAENEKQITAVVKQIQLGLERRNVNISLAAALADWDGEEKTLREYAEFLNDRADHLLNGSQELAWSCRFLASCLYFIDDAKAVSSQNGINESDRGICSLVLSAPYPPKKERRWPALAEMVNSLVNKLIPESGLNALFIYSALAS